MVWKASVLLSRINSQTKTVAIMQPTFLPWIGYFALISYVDEFILLDTVQFDRRSWQQRNRIPTLNGELLLTVPVMKKGKMSQPICEVQIVDDGRSLFEKMYRSISFNFSKSKYFNLYKEEFYEILMSESNSLSRLNTKIIKWGCKKLGITTSIINSSDLEVEGKREDLLLNICIARNAKKYISVEGSEAYLKNSRIFSQGRVSLEYFNYQHPKYHQETQTFVPFMSFVDLLFNNGTDSLRILQSGVGSTSGEAFHL